MIVIILHCSVFVGEAFFFWWDINPVSGNSPSACKTAVFVNTGIIILACIRVIMCIFWKRINAKIILRRWRRHYVAKPFKSFNWKLNGKLRHVCRFKHKNNKPKIPLGPLKMHFANIIRVFRACNIDVTASTYEKNILNLFYFADISSGSDCFGQIFELWDFSFVLITRNSTIKNNMFDYCFFAYIHEYYSKYVLWKFTDYENTQVDKFQLDKRTLRIFHKIWTL